MLRQVTVLLTLASAFSCIQASEDDTDTSSMQSALKGCSTSWTPECTRIAPSPVPKGYSNEPATEDPLPPFFQTGLSSSDPASRSSMASSKSIPVTSHVDTADATSTYITAKVTTDGSSMTVTKTELLTTIVETGITKACWYSKMASSMTCAWKLEGSVSQCRGTNVQINEYDKATSCVQVLHTIEMPMIQSLGELSTTRSSSFFTQTQR
jgi:hypothetical protein